MTATLWDHCIFEQLHFGTVALGDHSTLEPLHLGITQLWNRCTWGSLHFGTVALGDHSTLKTLYYVRREPWSATSRLHRYRGGAFSWHPLIRPSAEDRSILARPYSQLRTLKAVSSVFSAHTKKVLQHLRTCEQSPLKLSRMLTLHHLFPSLIQLTMAIKNYNHSSTVINSSTFYAQL